MPRFVEGEPRTQATLFPERIEDYIDADNPVRAIEAFVEALELEQLGFSWSEPQSHRQAVLSSGNDAKAVHLWLFESHPDHSSFGTRSGPQY